MPAKRHLQAPQWWMDWKRPVEVQRTSDRAFYATAYRVIIDDSTVGYVMSQRERGHTTLWYFAEGAQDRPKGGAPSRAMAVDSLLSYVEAWEDGYQAAKSNYDTGD